MDNTFINESNNQSVDNDNINTTPFMVVLDEFGYYTDSSLNNMMVNNSRSGIYSVHTNKDLSSLNKQSLIELLTKEQFVDIKTIDSSLKEDFQIALLAVKNYGWNFNYLSQPFQHNRTIFIEAIQNSPFLIDNWHDSFRDDKDIMLIALRQHGYYYSYSSSRLQHDRDIVLAAVNSQPFVLKHIAEEYRLDKDIVLTAVIHNPASIEYMPSQLNDDDDIILTAIKKAHCGKFIKYASERIKADKAIALQAVSSNGLAIRFLSEELKSDPDIALAALHNNIKSFKNIGSQLKEQIGNKDPIVYLTRFKMTEHLDNKLDKNIINKNDKNHHKLKL